MNKIIWISVVVAVLAIGGLGYYFFVYEPPARYRPVAEIPPPLEYTSLRGITLTHPEATSTQVTLNQIFATSQADFPAGRFEYTVGSTTIDGQLVAFDRLAHEGDDGRFATPVGVYEDETNTVNFYLGILEGAERRHTMSFPLGEDIDVTNIGREGERVTVEYMTFLRNQLRTDPPRLPTEAVFNIDTEETIKVGANVLFAQEDEIERFPRATYQWVQTTRRDDSVVTPETAQFKLEFVADEVRALADCNTGTGEYEFALGKRITIESLDVTSRFCESELEDTFFEMVEGVDSFEYQNGRLTLFGLDTMELVNRSIVTAESDEVEQVDATDEETTADTATTSASSQ